jgi:hypothetical protein
MLGVEDRSIVAVAAGGLRHIARRRNEPIAVTLVTQQRRETGVAVEAGPAQKVDRSRPGDERTAATVSDDRIVLDRRCDRSRSIQPEMRFGLSDTLRSVEQPQRS